jgi:small subunit ribosomal protein S2
MAKKKIVVDVEKLLEGGAHFGHQMRRWNPKMEEYMYKAQDGVFVFDLIKTKELLESALGRMAEVSGGGGVILFLGTKKQIKDKLKVFCESAGFPNVSERWLGGTLTNFAQMKRTFARMEELRDLLKTASRQEYTKKEILMMRRKLEKMERMIGGISSLEKVPDMLVVFDVKKEKGAVLEAKKLGVEVVGIVDSNGDPENIDWVIPMNDDATGALEYVLKKMEEAVGKSVKLSSKKEEKK